MVNKEPAARLYITLRFLLARGLNFKSRENRHENKNKSRKTKKNGATLGPVSFFKNCFSAFILSVFTRPLPLSYLPPL